VKESSKISRGEAGEKQERASKEEASCTPQQLPVATNQLLNKLLEQMMDLIARVIALEKELARQTLHYEETNRENIKMIVNNTLEIVKAFNGHV
jgi:hypothetical protein